MECITCFLEAFNITFGLNEAFIPCAHRFFKKDDIIIQESYHDRDLIYIKKGIVKLYLLVDGGKRLLVNISGEKSLLGLSSFFAQEDNQYIAMALTNTEVCVFKENDFRKIIQNSNSFLIEVYKKIWQNELNLVNKYLSLCQKQVHGRIAELILHLSNEVFQADEFEINITRKEIGQLVGTCRESVAKTLSVFCKEALIKLDGKKWILLNKDALVKISNTS